MIEALGALTDEARGTNKKKYYLKICKTKSTLEMS